MFIQVFIPHVYIQVTVLDDNSDDVDSSPTMGSVTSGTSISSATSAISSANGPSSGTNTGLSEAEQRHRNKVSSAAEAIREVREVIYGSRCLLLI